MVLQGASLTVPAYALTPGKVYSIACSLTILTRTTTVVRVVAVRSAAPQANPRPQTFHSFCIALQPIVE